MGPFVALSPFGSCTCRSLARFDPPREWRDTTDHGISNSHKPAQPLIAFPFALAAPHRPYDRPVEDRVMDRWTQEQRRSTTATRPRSHPTCDLKPSIRARKRSNSTTRIESRHGGGAEPEEGRCHRPRRREEVSVAKITVLLLGRYVGNMADAAYWPMLKKHSSRSFPERSIWVWLSLEFRRRLGITHIVNCAIEACVSHGPQQALLCGTGAKSAACL